MVKIISMSSHTISIVNNIVDILRKFKRLSNKPMRLKKCNKDKLFPEEKEDCMTDQNMILIKQVMLFGDCLILNKHK